MESGSAAHKTVHATIYCGFEQMWHNGAGHAGTDQGGARSDIVLSKILSRRHLRLLFNEHQRRQYSSLLNVIHYILSIIDYEI